MSEKAEMEKKQLPVELKINGQLVSARPGQTILEVVQEQNLDRIPTLCYDPRLEPYGSCFLCVVEVKGARGLVPACTTRVRDGMEVTTRSERIMNARKTALELLLSDHYADCVCPAHANCPAGVDVQGYISLAMLGYYEQALALIKQTNPLPLVCGRVCVRKCELNCRRNFVDEPVGINYVKRFVVEHSDHKKIKLKKKPATGKKVAIIGGGPAGLTCAYYLALEGHSIKIFEEMPALGGMLRWGIPEYRLPKEELDKEIGEILELGVKVELGKKLGRDFMIESLQKKDGFDAVFLALGAPKGQKLGVPGEDAEGVESAIDFLRNTALYGAKKLYGRVAVVGGGNSAIDASRTALRSGAKEVVLLYRRTRKEMPAHPEEVEAAEKEGVNLEVLCAPVEALTEKGRLKALKCIRMELGEPDESGRRRPVPIKGSEFEYPCDFVFSAIGQGTEPEVFEKESSATKPSLSRKGTVKVDEKTMATNLPGVFAGGDLVSGPSVAIDAIRDGQRASRVIHHYLISGEIRSPEPVFASKKEAFEKLSKELFEEIEKKPRHHLPEREPKERVKDFKEGEFSLSEADMKEEVSRCLECGCVAQFECQLRQYADEYKIDISRLAGAVRKYKLDQSHPLITLDPNKCILCGRCVRTCAEIVGLSVLGYVGRGFPTVIKPALGKSLLDSNCISCGECVESCPTGALSAKLPYLRQGPWRAKKVASVCNFCSLGCELELNVSANGLFWASSRETNGRRKGELCLKGRFGAGLINHSEQRLANPWLKDNNELKEADLESAIKQASRLLSQTIKRYGSDAVAVFASPRMTFEECYAVGKFARQVLGTDQITSFRELKRGGPRRDLDEILGGTFSSCAVEDIYSAELILVVGADPSMHNPVISMKLRRAIKNSAKLVVINSGNIDLVRFSSLWLDPRRGTIHLVLAEALKKIMERGRNEEWANHSGFQELKQSLGELGLDEISRLSGVEPEKIEKLVEMILGAKNLVAIYDLDDGLEKAPNDLSLLAQLLILTGHIDQPGNGLLLLESDCNSVGAKLAGMKQGILPGGYYLKDASAKNWESYWGKNFEQRQDKNPKPLLERFKAGEIKTAVVILEDPLSDPNAEELFKNLESLIVIDLFMTETAKNAQLVLPASSLAETQGSIISFDRKIKAIELASQPKSLLNNLELFSKLALGLKARISVDKPEAVRKEFCELVGVSYESLEKARKDSGVFPFSQKFPNFKRFQKVELGERQMQFVRSSVSSIEVYLEKRLAQMGLVK